MRLGEEIDHENFICYVEDYYETNFIYEQKGIKQLYHDFNKKIYKHQTGSHEDSLKMAFSENINGLAFTITYNSGRNKQDKQQSNHKFLIHIHQKSKHHSGEFCYEVTKWYNIIFQWVFRMKLIGVGLR